MYANLFPQYLQYFLRPFYMLFFVSFSFAHHTDSLFFLVQDVNMISEINKTMNRSCFTLSPCTAELLLLYISEIESAVLNL